MLTKEEQEYKRGYLEGLRAARTTVLEERCERNTPWDLCCTTIATKLALKIGQLY